MLITFRGQQIEVVINLAFLFIGFSRSKEKVKRH